MNWSDYEAAWKRQKLPVGMGADLPTLRATFEARSRKMHGALLVRDLAESGAGLVVVGAYAFFWWRLKAAGWPLAFAIALILGIGGVFVRERFRARRLRLGADAPLLAKVEADIAELRHQRRLLQTVWAWYLAPCAGAMAIQAAVVIRRLPSWDPLREPPIFLGFIAFFAVIFWFVWHLNRVAVKKQIQPRLDELEKLRADLLSES
jgi:hypothetical protein